MTAATVMVAVLVAAAFTAALYIYTTTQLSIAKASSGIHESPEEGMRALMVRSSFDREDVVIIHADPNSFDGSNPHVWYVAADTRPDVSAGGFRIGGSGLGAGSFFLQTKEGWVHLPEGAFPELEGFGMTLFGLVPDNCEVAGRNRPNHSLERTQPQHETGLVSHRIPALSERIGSL